MPKLIAFIDGSSYSESVLDHAAWAAKRVGGAVEVVHVIGRQDVDSIPADLSGNLDMGGHAALLAALAEHDRERAKLAKERGRLIVDAGTERLLAAGVAAAHPRLRAGDI